MRNPLVEAHKLVLSLREWDDEGMAKTTQQVGKLCYEGDPEVAMLVSHYFLNLFSSRFRNFRSTLSRPVPRDFHAQRKQTGGGRFMLLSDPTNIHFIDKTVHPFSC